MIAFLQPWWLALLPLWPLLAILVRRRDARAVVPAPDFLLWERASRSLPPAAPRSRFALRDLLWILPPVLVTAGLALPEWRGTAAAAETLVLVDRSASMATRDAQGATRLDRGLAEARRLLGARPHRFEGFPPASSFDRPCGAAVDARDLVSSAVTASAAGIPVMVVTDLPLTGLPPGAGLVQVSDGAANAGIASAGFDPAAGLVVRVEADPGAGPRTLVIRDGGGGELARRALADQASQRLVFPPDVLRPGTDAARALRTLALEPPDALALDDAVILVDEPRAPRIAIPAAAPAPVGRALRACPDVEVVDGLDPDAFALLVAPLSGVAGFATGPPAPASGAFTGSGAFEGLDGPAEWPAVFPLVSAPPGVRTLVAAGSAPLVVRHERTFVLLADPEASGWALLPSFPLTIARIADVCRAAAGTRFEVHPAGRPVALAAVPDGATWEDPGGGTAPVRGGVVVPDGVGEGRVVAGGRVLRRLSSGVLSAGETRVARAGPAEARAARGADAPPRARPLAPWLHAAALIAMLALIAAWISARRGGATPRTRPASDPAAAIRRTARS
jgi:hypothetical protein